MDGVDTGDVGTDFIDCCCDDNHPKDHECRLDFSSDGAVNVSLFLSEKVSEGAKDEAGGFACDTSLATSVVMAGTCRCRSRLLPSQNIAFGLVMAPTSIADTADDVLPRTLSELSNALTSTLPSSEDLMVSLLSRVSTWVCP